MLSRIDWPKSRSYRTGTDYEPIQFYMDGLCQSNRLDLLLGYFSSSAINVLSLGFAKFLYSGGVVRIVTNHILAKKDKEAIKKSVEISDNPNPLIDITNIKYLKQTLDEYGRHFFECLAWLMANRRIDLKVIKPNDGKGIAHYKSGAFFDGENTAVFKASCNFTAYGLLENAEELECHLSWDPGAENRIEDQTEYFENIFSGNATHLDYLDVDGIQEAIKNEFGDKTIEELLVQEKDLIEKKSKLFTNPKLKRKLKAIQEDIEEIEGKPRFPYPIGPREYQIVAHNNWVANNYQGIFAMATGTGKTITALNCLLNEYKKTNFYRAVITVPTTALVEQWKKECRKFNYKNIITVSSKESWESNISFFNTASRLTKTSFIIIVTYASFSKPKFQSHFKQLTSDALLIADETHNFGSKGLLKILPYIHLVKRIGLSATPHRKFDEEGNEEIERFFNDKFPYVVSYSMQQALEIGWLCKYTYYPHVVRLNEVELAEYIRISKQLLRFLDPETKSYKKSPEVETLLLARKRIIHKAANKIDAFKAILKDEFQKRGNLKYTLVYVPEGVEANYEETDFNVENDEENKLINEYTRVVSNTDDSIMVKQFTANSQNREEILEDFEAGRIHVLTSMKCLDEGVDVPRSELAIFCASTGNPRQFIQRRGRVLRLHNDKIHATIHDLVVVPEINLADNTYEMERNLVRKELERVVDFSSLAMNKMDTYEALKEVLDYYNLNLNDF